MEITALICMAFACVFVMPKYSYNPYIVPRETFLTLAGFGLMGWWLAQGAPVRMPADILTVILMMFGWWFFCALVSPMPHIAVRQTLKFALSACFGLFLVSGAHPVTGAVVLVVTALVNSLYGIAKYKFKFEPFKLLRRRKMVGLIGNSNLFAAYLVPHVFLTAYLGTQHPAWYAALIPLLYALWLTGCRAGQLAVMAGGTVVAWHIGPEALVGHVVLCVCTLLVIGKRWVGHKQSLIERTKYWRIAWTQIRKTPVCGLGFDVYKAKVPYLQREINDKTGGKFLADRQAFTTPYAKRAHSDYLQHVVDNGIFGLVVISVITACGLMNTGNLPFHAAGLVGLLVFAFFLHTFHITVVNVILWYLIGCLVRIPEAVTWDIPLIAWSCYGLLAYMVYQYTIRPAMQDILVFQYHATGRDNLKILTYAVDTGPRTANVLNLVTGYYHDHKDYNQAYEYGAKALHHFDGEDKIWIYHMNMGEVCLAHGSMSLAMWHVKEALAFCPWWQPAINKLKMLERITIVKPY